MKKIEILRAITLLNKMGIIDTNLAYSLIQDVIKFKSEMEVKE
jgi:hypothetical protein